MQIGSVRWATISKKFSFGKKVGILIIIIIIKNIYSRSTVVRKLPVAEVVEGSGGRHSALQNKM